jgi:hypothetical protein
MKPRHFVKETVDAAIASKLDFPILALIDGLLRTTADNQTPIAKKSSCVPVQPGPY